MPTTELRRTGEHRFSIADHEQEANQYVGRHGLEAYAKNYVRIADTLNIDPLDLLTGIAGITLIDNETEQPSEVAEEASTPEPEAPPSLPEPEAPLPKSKFVNRHGKPITKARHKGGLKAWETRHAIAAMMEANPRLSRLVALALYRDEHPRSRAKNLKGPRRRATKTKGQTSWDTRVKNIIKKHRIRTGQTLKWSEAHQMALKTFQGGRQAA